MHITSGRCPKPHGGSRLPLSRHAGRGGRGVRANRRNIERSHRHGTTRPCVLHSRLERLAMSDDRTTDNKRDQEVGPPPQLVDWWVWGVRRVAAVLDDM